MSDVNLVIVNNTNVELNCSGSETQLQLIIKSIAIKMNNGLSNGYCRPFKIRGNNIMKFLQ